MSWTSADTVDTPFLDQMVSGSRTVEGAPCLSTTGSVNVDIFASPFIFFDGRDVSFDVTSDVETLRAMLTAAYEEDPVLAIQNILYLGNLRDGGTKNHPAHMVSMVWLWEKHPDTFLSVVAPRIASNTCIRDILTLFSVITYNHNFPVHRLWSGEQPDASRDARRNTLRTEEHALWKALLNKVGKKPKDVVEAVPLMGRASVETSLVDTEHLSPLQHNTDSPGPSPAVLHRDCERPSLLSPASRLAVDSIWMTSTTQDEVETLSDISGASVSRPPTWGSGLRPKKGVVPATRWEGKRKNYWHDEEFRDMWHVERAKLHNRYYGPSSGVPGDPTHYQALSDFVVGFFATSLMAENKMAGKWAPTPGGAHDKATKGVKAFNLPESWGGKGGLSQAIAYQIFGHLVKSTDGDGVPGNVLTIDGQKSFVMAKYKKLLSNLRKDWVPEHNEGRSDTFTKTPDLKLVTSRWRSYKAPRILRTDQQKSDLVAYTERVVAGEKGCKVTCGSAKPHLLFQEACLPEPGTRHSYGDEGSVEELSIADWVVRRKTAVLQWEAMQAKATKAIRASDMVFLPVCDVSGSMTGTPMEICKALGVLLSFASPEDSPYHATVLSFETTCQVIKLTAGYAPDADRFNIPTNLQEELAQIPWGGSTQLESVFEAASKLEKERLSALVDNPLVKKKRCVIVIFSDMEFSEAVQSGDDTMSTMLQPDVLQALCLKVGLEEIPLLVFWNCASSGKTSLPAGVDANNIILLSGSSDGNFQALLTADFSSVTPAAYMRQAFAKLPYSITSGDIID